MIGDTLRALGYLAAGLAIVALVVLAGQCACSGPATVVRVEKTTVHEKVPCLSVPPPKVPSVNCGGLPPDDCRGIEMAAWSEYGKDVRGWVELYAWPACTERP